MKPTTRVRGLYSSRSDLFLYHEGKLPFKLCEGVLQMASTVYESENFARETATKRILLIKVVTYEHF